MALALCAKVESTASLYARWQGNLGFKQTGANGLALQGAAKEPDDFQKHINQRSVILIFNLLLENE
jgi:hypothetical protein